MFGWTKVTSPVHSNLPRRWPLGTRASLKMPLSSDDQVNELAKNILTEQRALAGDHPEYRPGTSVRPPQCCSAHSRLCPD